MPDAPDISRKPWYRPRNILLGFVGVFLIGVLFLVWQIGQISAAVPGTNPTGGQQVLELVERYQPEGFRDRPDLPNAYEMLLEACDLAEPIRQELTDRMNDGVSRRWLDEEGEPLFFSPGPPFYYASGDAQGLIHTGDEIDDSVMAEFEAYLIDGARFGIELYAEAGIPDLLAELAATPRAVRNDALSSFTQFSFVDWGSSRSLAVYGQARVHLAVQDNDHESLVESFEQTLAIGRVLKHQNSLIDQMTGDAVQLAVAEPVSQVLVEKTLEPRTLRSLLAAWERQGGVPPPELAFEGERLLMLDLILITHSDDGHGSGYFLPVEWDTFAWTSFPLLTGMGGSPTIHNAPGLLMPRKAAMVDAVNDLYDHVIAAAHTQAARRPSIEDYTQAMPSRFFMLSENAAVFDSSFRIYDTSQMRFGSMRLHLAVELHRAEHDGTPPSSLAELVPTYLPALPADPFAPDGRFRYRVLDEPDEHGRVYLLYSVAADGVDQDGEHAIGRRARRDTLYNPGLESDYIINHLDEWDEQDEED